MSIVLAVDVGVTGAIAAVDSRGTCTVADLPTVSVPGKRTVRRRIDSRGLMQIVRGLVPPGETCLALLEDVHMRPGNGGAATASLLHSRGVVETVLELARLDVRAIQPATWKRHHGLIGTQKGSSLDKARESCPTVAHMLKRQLDHNRAEALLIARFGLETMT